MALASVQLETTLTPPVLVTTDDLFGGGGEEPSWLQQLALDLLRPKLTITTPLGATVKAPGGDPGEAWQWVLPVAAVGLLVGGALAAYGLWTLLLGRR